MTTQAQRNIIYEIADEILKLRGVKRAVVDDDNGHGSFNVFVELHNPLQGDYASRRIEFEIPLHGLIARITGIIKRHGGKLEWHEPPRRLYSRPLHGKKLFDGYDADSYKLSVYIPQLADQRERPKELQMAFA